MPNDTPIPQITSPDMMADRYFITCPFTHENEYGSGQVYDEYDHPKGFVHTHENCQGVVDLAQYLVWLGQEVSIKYTNPGKQPV